MLFYYFVIISNNLTTYHLTIVDKNPFSFLFEHPQYPHARTLRTSTTQKIKDSLSVFTGNIAIDTPSSPGINCFFQATHWEQMSEQMRLGLFDYLILGIPYGVTWCLAKLLVAIQAQKIKYQDESDKQEAQNNTSFLLRTALSCVEGTVWISFVLWNLLTHGLLRILVSLLGVFFLGLPFSLLVNYGRSFYSSPLKQVAFTLQGIKSIDDRGINCLSDHTVNDRHSEHQQLPTVERINLEEFLLYHKGLHVQSLGDTEQYTSSVVKQVVSLKDVYYLIIEHPFYRLKFYAEINHDNLAAIDALATLNFANIDNTLEKMCLDNSQLVTSQSWMAKSHFFRAFNPVEDITTTKTKTTFVNCWRSVFPGG